MTYLVVFKEETGYYFYIFNTFAAWQFFDLINHFIKQFKQSLSLKKISAQITTAATTPKLISNTSVQAIKKYGLSLSYSPPNSITKIL